MRRVITFFVVAIGTAAATTAWLSDQSPQEVLLGSAPTPREWDADALAEREGLSAEPPLAPPPPADP